MDEVITLILELLSQDIDILQIFSDCGQFGSPNITSAADQSEVVYPWIFVRNPAQSQVSSMDHLSNVWDGEILVEIRVKRSDNCKQPEAIRWALFNRVMALLYGDGTTAPVVGSRTNRWAITVFGNVNPTGDIPDPDPLMRRHKITSRVMILRQG